MQWIYKWLTVHARIGVWQLKEGTCIKAAYCCWTEEQESGPECFEATVYKYFIPHPSFYFISNAYIVNSFMVTNLC